MKYILLVDDDADDREILEDALQKVCGPVMCRTADDGRHALEVLDGHDHGPEVIFLDLNMPRMGGLDFLSRFKGSSHQDVPVVIYSTSALQADKDAAYALGARYYIVKQSKFALLCSELEYLFTIELKWSCQELAISSSK